MCINSGILWSVCRRTNIIIMSYCYFLANVVNSLTGAINSRDKDYAITLLNALLSSETTLGSVSINLKDPIKNIQKEKTFV